jgi:hypothetical protein
MKSLDGSAGKVGRGVADFIDSLQRELRTNPRARLGLVLVAVVLLVAGGLRAWTYTEGRQVEIEALKTQVDELEALGSDTQSRLWAAAEKDTSKGLARVKGLFWSNEPIGASHADFYAWIEDAAAKAGLPGAQIRLGRTRKLGAEGQVTEMSVTVFVPFAPTPPTTEAMFTFLTALKNNQRVIHARSLRVQFEPANLFEGEFVAYAPSAPTGGDKSASRP